ncbi:MAG: hypothetical protein KAS57_08955 [Gammaproteobacteria bacterium]|nr:hypothetical protein [Gammaproteobacteria bacterium]
MPANNPKLQHIIEQLCTTGCERVNEVIEILERQENIQETGQLSTEESKIVLHELKAIMAVYEQE